MVKHPKTVKSMNEVWTRLMDLIGKDKTAVKIVATEFNAMLDTLLCDDFFGTEGQCDPRGDHRD
jgi:transcription elongation factor GreA-like protein